MLTSFNISLIFLLIIFQIKAEDKLVFVKTHFRHGARAPEYYYNEPYDYVKENWTSPGELTGIGQRMHYLLGIRNRIWYINETNFLSKTFNPHEILIYSSSYNRTIVSVSSQLQGLYPQFEHIGEKLTKEQEDNAVPRVNIDYDIIKTEIENLNLSALPHSMMLAPVRMISNIERKITVYDIEGCTDKRDNIKQKNQNLPSLIDIVNTFKGRFGEKLNEFYNSTIDYNLTIIGIFCDAFIASYTDKREMIELNETGLNLTEINDYCHNFGKLNFRDWLLGDDEHVLAYVEVSRLMKEFIHYMKIRVDADINHEDIDSDYQDFSRPKMLMVSGHDSTVSCHEVFLMDIFGKNLSFYEYPQYATQIAFEVTTNDNTEANKTYEDYFIQYYFNDELKLNVSVKEFIDKVEPRIWSDKKINDFCGLNGNDDKESSTILIILIIFISLTVIFLVVIVILSIILYKNNKRLASYRPNSLIPKDSEG